MPKIEDKELLALNVLELEYRLTIAHRIDCWCSRYLIERRFVLLPEILRSFMASDEEEIDEFFHTFALKLHEKKCPTMDQPVPFVEQVIQEIRDTIGEDPDQRVKSETHPVECSDCHSGVGQHCISGCPNLD